MAENAETDLGKEVAALRREVALLNSHKFVTLHNSIWKLLGYRFASGLALGLGTVLGGSILLSFVVIALTSIDFIPVIGEWAAKIAAEMDVAR